MSEFPKTPGYSQPIAPARRGDHFSGWFIVLFITLGAFFRTPKVESESPPLFGWVSLCVSEKTGARSGFFGPNRQAIGVLFVVLAEK